MGYHSKRTGYDYRVYDTIQYGSVWQLTVDLQLLARLVIDIGYGCRRVEKEKLRVEGDNKGLWDGERGEVRRFEGTHSGPPTNCGAG